MTSPHPASGAESEPSPHLRLSGYDAPGPEITPRPTLPDPPIGPRRQIDDWLGRLRTHLRCSDDRASGISDELESHLTERTRDLILAGEDEPSAVRRALAELGDPRGLAGEYRRLRTIPARRFLMNASMFLLTGAALSLSILAVSTHPATPAWCPPTDSDSAADHPSALLALRANQNIASETAAHRLRLETALDQRTNTLSVLPVLTRFTSPADGAPAAPEIRTSTFKPPSMLPDDIRAKRVSAELKDAPLTEALRLLADSAGLRPVIFWEAINNIGAAEDTPVSLVLNDTPIDDAVRMLSEAIAHPDPRPLAVRSNGISLEIASVAFFDERESSLVSYDLSSVVSVDTESLQELIQTFVEPDGWVDRGGNSAWLKFAGTKMFVQAPKRYHTHIEWFLNELRSSN